MISNEKKELLIDFLLGGCSFILDILNEIMTVVLVLPKIFFLSCVAYLIYQPEMIKYINVDLAITILTLINVNITPLLQLFLSFVLMSLLFRYLLGIKKFILGCFILDLSKRYSNKVKNSEE
ncbi:hypothetical protein [Xenorhabdus entomophaga]|uniref:hypothetical protein n=1 Tax=Xenorhabdus entomophaga TaxID=3136257 RepID=UPI0030F3C9E8